jgi:AraC-like DNA-binding protein
MYAARSVALPVPDPFAALVAARAVEEGVTASSYPGVRFLRVSQPTFPKKVVSLGPALTVVAQGRKRTRVGDEELSYDPSRCLVTIGEGCDCSGMVVEASQARPYLAVHVEIPSDLVAKTLHALADADAAPVEDRTAAFVSLVDEGLRGTVDRFVRAIDDPLERRIVAPLILEELVFRLLRSDAAALVRRAVRRDRETVSVEEAMRYVRENLASVHAVDTLARHVHMSPSHFAHRFRAVARVSPMKYVKQARLFEAQRLLSLEGLRVGEVAGRVGYESAAHFTRDFKRHFGVTPVAYARRLHA